MAVGTGSLSMSDEPREPSDDTSILARGGLHDYVRQLRKAVRQWNPMSYSGIRILTISPGAWPWATTRLRLRRRRWNRPEGESFPSWTLRPPRLWRPSFSYLPLQEGEHLLLLPHLWGRSAPPSHRTVSPTTPSVGNSFELPWLSGSSPAPYKEPESTSSPEGRRQGLRAREPDSRFVRPSSASPVKITGV